MMPERAQESRGLVKACIRLLSAPVIATVPVPGRTRSAWKDEPARLLPGGGSEGAPLSASFDVLEPERLQAGGRRNAVGVPAAEAVVVVEHRAELGRRAVHSRGRT